MKLAVGIFFLILSLPIFIGIGMLFVRIMKDILDTFKHEDTHETLD